MNQGLTLSILAFIGIAIFMNIQKNTIENFAGMPFPMTWKINREVTVPRCNNKPKIFSVSGNYQSSLTPRFSNVSGYGTRIRYRKPCRGVMGVPEHPLTYYKNAVDSCNPVVEHFDGASQRRGGCNMQPLADLSTLDINDKCGAKRCPQSATVTGMLPVTDMRTINAMTSVQTRENQQDIEGALTECGAPSSICEDNQQPIVYDRLIYANARSRLRGAGCAIRGDIPIVPILPESNPDSLVAFRPSVSPNIDLQQGALSVMGGYDNTTQKQLNSLIQRSSGGTLSTFAGTPINNSVINCASSSDIVVSNFL